MLEDHCHLIDVKIAADMANISSNKYKKENINFEEYIEARQRLRDLAVTIAADCDEKISLVHDAITTAKD